MVDFTVSEGTTIAPKLTSRDERGKMTYPAGHTQVECTPLDKVR